MTTPKYALIIGGTGFISQYCVEELKNAGFIVATMNRGSSIDLHGDKVSHRFIVNCRKRQQFVSALRDSVKAMNNGMGIDAWDIVIDFICYEPPHAEDCVKGLENICKLFVLISTDSTYEVCTRPSCLDEQNQISEANLQSFLTHLRAKNNSIPSPQSPTVMSDDDEESILDNQRIHHKHPGRDENDQTLLSISEKELRRKDEYGLEKLQCEHIFLKAGKDSLNQFNHGNGIGYPFETVWLRLPDVTGERELPRSRHFQLQMRIQLGLPIYIDPESNKYNVDKMNLPGYYDPNDKDFIINKLPPYSAFPQDAVKLSFVHARDVSTALIAAHRLQNLALNEQNSVNNNNADDDDGNINGNSTGKYTKSWSIIRNTGINIASLEQVTLLEYLYLIGNTLKKPVFVYGSSDGREALLRQHVKAMNNRDDDVEIPSNRIYPKSYHQLYLEYFTNNVGFTSQLNKNCNNDSTNNNSNSNPVCLENGRFDMTYFASKFARDSTLHPHNILQTLNIKDTCPCPHYHQNETITTCLDCQQYLSPIQYNEQQRIKIHEHNDCWCAPWCQQTETPPAFISSLIAAGYTCPLPSSSSDSDSSNSSSSDDDTSGDDSDYDDFFAGNFAKAIVSPIFEHMGKVEKINPATLNRKAKIAAVVKRVILNSHNNNNNNNNNTNDTSNNSNSTNDNNFSLHNLNHLHILHLLERIENADQCSYLPSVTQGPISIQKALDHLPGWQPTCLYAWCAKQTIWYMTPTFMNAMDADPRNTIWKLDQKWGKYFRDAQ